MRHIKTFAAIVLALSGSLAVSTTAQPFRPGPKIAPPPLFKGGAAVDPILAAAVGSDVRPAADKARDGARHPIQSLEFWGLRPGMTIVDLNPGAGYWTYILAPYAKATGGRYVAAGSERGRAPFMTRFVDAVRFGAVGYNLFDKTSPPFAPASSVDLVLSSREIHNWIGDGYLGKAMSDVAAALKPGGVFAVEEHRADPTVQKPGASNGYVSTATVIAAAKKAGLVFDASSEVNANPRDTKDYPFGVWTLPPVRQSSTDGKSAPPPGFDRARYDAIGESDRMTLRFRKPG